MNNKLLIAKVEDKIRICKTKNIITHTEFLNEYQIEVAQKELSIKKEKNICFMEDMKMQ